MLLWICAGGWAPSTPGVYPGTSTAQCFTGPIGSCAIFGCIEGRHAECHWPGCYCRPNLCAEGSFFHQTCSLPHVPMNASVKRVDAAHPDFPKPHNEVHTA